MRDPLQDPLLWRLTVQVPAACVHIRDPLNCSQTVVSLGWNGEQALLSRRLWHTGVSLRGWGFPSIPEAPGVGSVSDLTDMQVCWALELGWCLVRVVGLVDAAGACFTVEKLASWEIWFHTGLLLCQDKYSVLFRDWEKSCCFLGASSS